MTTFHLETTAGALAAALKTANMVRPKRATVPILTAVLLRNRCMHATCLEVDIAVPFAAKRMTGALAIDAGSLGLLRLLSSDTDVSIQGNAQGAILSFPGGSYDLLTYEASDFPDPLDGDDKESLAGNQASGFQAALANVAYAISTEETRYYLNGVCLSRFGEEPCVVATNGHQLAWHDAHMPWPESWDGTIVPSPAVRAINRLGSCQTISLVFCYRQGNGDANSRRYPRLLQVDCAGVRLTTKLIDGTYPDWQRVVPKALGGMFAQDAERSTRQLAVPVQPLRQALKRLASRQQVFRSTGVTLAPQADGRLAVSGRVDGALAVEVMPLPATNVSDPLKHGVGCNAAYLGELLSHARDSEVTLVTDIDAAHIDPAHPTKNIGGPFGFKHDDGGHIMMPMRTDSPDELDLRQRVEAVLSEGAGKAA